MTDPEARVARVPWEALAGLAPLLDAPLAHILDGSPADRTLDRLLRDHPDFTAPQRTACAEALFGVGLWRRRLRAQCGPSASPRQLLAALVRDPGGRSDAAVLLDTALPPAATLSSWRDRFSIPDWLGDLLEEQLGATAPALAAALDAPGPICLRANRLRTTREALADALAADHIETRPGALARDSLIVTSARPNLLGSRAAQASHFEVQDEGSQLLGELLGAREGDHVLDLCAGAGGKALQLACIVGARGVVHATDVDLAKLERLRHRAARAGATVRIHGRLPPSELRVPFVLVDAPCSELGALRRGPDLRWRMDPSTFAPLPALQLDLLERAARHVTPDGRIAFATCTFRPQENEAVVREFLGRHPEFRLTSPQVPHVDDQGFLRLWPHRHDTDGFFGALLVRAS